MTLKLRNGFVAIKTLESAEKSVGGIYIPPTADQGAFRTGRIVETGPGEWIFGQFVENDLSKGQTVIFDVSKSYTLVVDGESLKLCNMKDVVGVIETKKLSVVPPCQ